MNDLKFRQLKIQTETKWKKFGAVNTEEKLMKILDRYKPKNTYYSTGKFLSTRNLENPSYKVADRLLLGSDVVIDIDAKMFIEQEDCDERTAKRYTVLQAKVIHNFMKDHFQGLLEYRQTVLSGGGIHLIYRVINLDEADPKTRLIYHDAMHKMVSESLRLRKFVIDYPVCEDLYRVIRVPGTYNGNKGTYSQEISSPDTWTVQDILIHASRITAMTKTCLMTVVETPLSNGREGQAGVVDNRPLPSFFKYRFVDVKLDKNNYVPFLVLPDKWYSKSKIERLAKQYGHRFYVFKRGKDLFALSPRLVSLRRYLKMLRFVRAKNTNKVAKTGHSQILLSEARYFPDNGNIHLPKPEFKYAVGEDKQGFYSKVHKNILSNFGCDVEVNGRVLDKWKVKRKIAVTVI